MSGRSASRPSLGAQILALFPFNSSGKSQFKICLGKRLEVPDFLPPKIRNQLKHLLGLLSLLCWLFSFSLLRLLFGKPALERAMPARKHPNMHFSKGHIRKAPDTFNFLRHVMRAIWSVRPKCSHRCVSLKKTPLKPSAKPQAHKQKLSGANRYENEMV